MKRGVGGGRSQEGKWHGGSPEESTCPPTGPFVRGLCVSGRREPQGRVQQNIHPFSVRLECADVPERVCWGGGLFFGQLCRHFYLGSAWLQWGVCYLLLTSSALEFGWHK